MPRIFISYRRADSAAMTGWIHNKLADTFGETNVFRDVHDILAGEDFRAKIEQEIITSDVMLVIIGRDWLRITNDQGARRLDDPSDYVRQEIEMALRHRLEVFPVLINRAKMPSGDELPRSLYDLAFRNAVTLRSGPHLEQDIQALAASLRRVRSKAPAEKSASGGRLVWIVSLVLIVGLIGALLLLSGIGRENNDLKEAYEFLLDVSDNMNVEMDGQPRYLAAQSLISQIVTEINISKPDAWVSLRTVGGASGDAENPRTQGDCLYTQQVVHGISADLGAGSFITSLTGLQQGGNTAYQNGFIYGFSDMQAAAPADSDLRFLLIFLGSLSPSDPCRLYDTFTPRVIIDRAKREDVSLVMCVLTFLEDLDQFEEFKNALQGSGVTCVDNATSAEDATDFARTVSEAISRARLDYVPSDGPQVENLTVQVVPATATPAGTLIGTPTSPLTPDVTESGLQANAGADMTFNDQDGNGLEIVSLDASGSAGDIASYVWTLNDIILATGVNPMVSLAAGASTITLTVTGKNGQESSDTVTITVLRVPTATPTTAPATTQAPQPTIRPTSIPTPQPTITSVPTFFDLVPPTDTPDFALTATALSQSMTETAQVIFDPGTSTSTNTPDFGLTATAIIRGATETVVSMTQTAQALPSPTDTPDFALTATAIVSGATQTAAANATQTAQFFPTATPNFELTATAIIRGATETSAANDTQTAQANLTMRPLIAATETAVASKMTMTARAVTPTPTPTPTVSPTPTQTPTPSPTPTQVPPSPTSLKTGS